MPELPLSLAGFPMDSSKLPPDDVVKTFLEHYLRKRRQMEGVSEEVKSEDIECLFKETHNYFLVNIPYFGLFCPC